MCWVWRSSISCEMNSCSPCSALWEAATSRFVTPDIAETTATTGRWAAVDLTIAAARPMQLASPTDVPPNFITWSEFDIYTGIFACVAALGEGESCRGVRRLQAPTLPCSSRQPPNLPCHFERTEPAPFPRVLCAMGSLFDREFRAGACRFLGYFTTSSNTG